LQAPETEALASAGDDHLIAHQLDYAPNSDEGYVFDFLL
jgi:hypothetical protein